MREKLNENPKAQVALVAGLVAIAVLFFISKSGGGEEEAVGATEATVAVAGTSATGTATGATPGEAVEGAVEGALEAAGEAGVPAAAPSSIPASPPPRAVTAAYDSGKTVVLLIVQDGDAEDQLVTQASQAVAGRSDVALFTVPVGRIARYAAITVGLEVNRVPALVVMRPKQLSGGTPQASVDYGFQTSQGVLQAVQDAAYDGREVTYHPN